MLGGHPLYERGSGKHAVCFFSYLLTICPSVLSYQQRCPQRATTKLGVNQAAEAALARVKPKKLKKNCTSAGVLQSSHYRRAIFLHRVFEPLVR